MGKSELIVHISMLIRMQLVDSIEPIYAHTSITEEWFGIVLLPIVSFSADGAVAIGYFIKRTVSYILKLRKPDPPATLAKAEGIDLSIQFLLFWAPLVTLLGWWTNKPFTLLFGGYLWIVASLSPIDIYFLDFFEVGMLLGACFLVNYVTQDSKTNWIEGLVLLCFYAMIVGIFWYF